MRINDNALQFKSMYRHENVIKSFAYRATYKSGNRTWYSTWGDVPTKICRGRQLESVYVPAQSDQSSFGRMKKPFILGYPKRTM